MKTLYSILTVLTFVTLFSCSDINQDKTKTNKGDSVSNSSGTVISDTVTINHTADTLATTNQNSLNSLTNCLDNQIFFKCLEKCGEGFPSDKKGNGDTPFKVKKITTGDTTIIKFHFVSDCGQNYVKETQITGDTIYLKYKSNSSEIIEAYCEYYYQFTLTNCKWTTIYLMGKKI